MEGSEMDDAGTSQMGLEGVATLIEEGVQDERMTPRIGMEFPTHDHACAFYNRYALKIGFRVRRSSNSYSRKDKSKVISETQLHSEGIRNSAIAMMVDVVEVGQFKHENVTPQPDIVTPQQVHDHLRVERRNNIGQNCAKVIKHFQDKKANDSDFYFSFEVSEDLTLRSVFWADGRSRESYLKFSDVIVFDVTYRTNNFSLPFAPFTGINHHRQSTLFGCALLADETEETFVWLFKQWLTCMHDIAPRAIITDQDAAIGNAIARVFPDSRHRYCDWHMDRNIGEHMVHLKAIHVVEFEMYFKKLQGSDNIPDAEKCWNEPMEKYKLPEKSWLPKLWDKRKSWIPCFLKDIFLAGTRTSQRSESMNSFFDSFVNANTLVHEFVVQYDRALINRRTTEENANFYTMNTKPTLTLGWQAEKQAGRCYTKAIFDIFKQELKDAQGYWNDMKHTEGTATTFRVGRPQSDRNKWRIVKYDDSDGVVVSCECKLFEFTGLLCRHGLGFLRNKQVHEIPDRYILKRWTIDAHHHQRVSCGRGPKEADNDRDWRLRYKCNMVLEEAYKSHTLFEEFETYLSKKLGEIAQAAQPVDVDASSQVFVSQVGSTATPTFENINLLPQEITIRDPTGCVRTKGRPRTTTRIQSGLEISQAEKSKKQRTCGFCGDKGHYKTGVPKPRRRLLLGLLHPLIIDFCS